jgi:hypothetical protein
MPAVDQCEPQVIRALDKAGWQIMNRPYSIKLVGRRGYVFADLRLRSHDQEIIVVEAKCFADPDGWLEELYRSIGQYMLYRNALRLRELPQSLYLTVPTRAYQQLFLLPAVQATVNEAKIKLIVIDLDREVIVSWLN